MRKIIVVIMLFIACGINIYAANEDKKALIVETKQGSKVAFVLADKPKVHFEVGDMVVNSKDVTINYPIVDLERLRFSYATGIDEAKKNCNVGFAITNENLQVWGLEAGEQVLIYNMSGQMIVSAKADDSGLLSISIANMTNGAYLVKTNNVNFKIIK